MKSKVNILGVSPLIYSWAPSNACLRRPEVNGLQVRLPVECDVRVGVEDHAVSASHEASPGGQSSEAVMHRYHRALARADTSDITHEIVRLQIAANSRSANPSEVTL